MKRRDIVRALGLDTHQIRLLDGRVQPNSFTDIVWLCQNADPERLEGLGATLATMEGEEEDWASAALSLEDGSAPFKVALQKLGALEMPADFWSAVIKTAKQCQQTTVEQLAVQKKAELANGFEAWHEVFHEAKDCGLDAVKQTALEKMAELMGNGPGMILITYGDSEPGSSQEAAAAKAFRDLRMPVPLLLMIALGPNKKRSGDLLLDLILEGSTTVAQKLTASVAILNAEAFSHRQDLEKISQQLLDDAWLLALKMGFTKGGVAVYDAFPPNSTGRQVIYEHFAGLQNVPAEDWIKAYEQSHEGTPLRVLFLQRALAAAEDAVPTNQTA